MNSYPLISVIISAYNHEKYVELALNSILEDDYPNKEIVIINDGSKDSTSKIIESWINNNKERIPVIYKDRENKGLVKTLNELIDMANGEFIVLLASDDFLLPGSLFARYNYLKTNPHKMAVIGDCIVVDSDGEKTHDSATFDIWGGNRKNYINPKALRKEIIFNFSVPGPVLMVDKKIYKKVGKYDENISYEDLDFYLKVAGLDLIGFIDSKVSAYRVHSTNTCFASDFEGRHDYIYKKNAFFFWDLVPELFIKRCFKHLKFLCSIFKSKIKKLLGLNSAK